MTNGDEEVFEIEVVVYALLPEFHQALVRDGRGFQYAITRRTTGLALEDLHEGQHLRCVVTRVLPRVISAVAAGL